ncbi:MAG: DUF488 domain-containing protein [Rhizobiaceae bacterium]|jgi:uncharacterized protein YeaO (DUF488 family)
MNTKRADDAAGRIRTKRIYDPAQGSDGSRVLVDRIWPRGMSRDRAGLDRWDKEIAPSDALRKWFHANPDRWEEFKERYRAELKDKDAELDALASAARSGTLTLLFASADEAHNNAVVLREVLLRREGA